MKGIRKFIQQIRFKEGGGDHVAHAQEVTLPMDNARREANYVKQNGAEKLTPKQGRRMGHHAARNLSND